MNYSFSDKFPFHFVHFIEYVLIIDQFLPLSVILELLPICLLEEDILTPLLTHQIALMILYVNIY